MSKVILEIIAKYKKSEHRQAVHQIPTALAWQRTFGLKKDTLLINRKHKSLNRWWRINIVKYLTYKIKMRKKNENVRMEKQNIIRHAQNHTKVITNLTSRPNITWFLKCIDKSIK